MKILTMEDSGLIRRAIVKVANEKGFEAIEAENGAEGLMQLRKNAKDLALIILDWNMPVMDGYEVLQKIRANDDYDNIPILMATSDGVAEDVVKAIKAGANSYLVKPFNRKELSDRIDEVLKT